MTPKDAAYEALAELISIGVGRAAEVLNSMLGSHVRLSAPSLRVMSPADLAGALTSKGEGSLSAVEMDFSGEFSGSAELVFASQDAGKLVDCITAGIVLPGEEDRESIRAGTLCEVGNIVINAILGTIANVIHAELQYSVPLYLQGRPEALLLDASLGAGVILLVNTCFQVESIEVDGDIVVFLSLESFGNLETALGCFING